MVVRQALFLGGGAPPCLGGSPRLASVPPLIPVPRGRRRRRLGGAAHYGKRCRDLLLGQQAWGVTGRGKKPRAGTLDVENLAALERGPPSRVEREDAGLRPFPEELQELGTLTRAITGPGPGHSPRSRRAQHGGLD